jgi:hypothetical protein
MPSRWNHRLSRQKRAVRYSRNFLEYLTALYFFMVDYFS